MSRSPFINRISSRGCTVRGAVLWAWLLPAWGLAQPAPEPSAPPVQASNPDAEAPLFQAGPLGGAPQAPDPASPDPTYETEEEEEVEVLEAPEQVPVEAPRYVVDAVRVAGNWRTLDRVILQRIDVRPGELLDEERITISRLRLLATGYFRDVRTRLERGGVRNHVVVVFEVEERLPIPVLEGIYLGFSQVTPLFGGLSLVDNNFLGRGMVLGFGGVASPAQQAGRIRLEDPSILGGPLGLRMRLLANNGLEPISLGSSATAGGTLRYRRLGGSGGLTLSQGGVGRFTMDWRFEVLDGQLTLVPGSARPPRLLPGRSRLSTLTLGFDRDTRDRAFVPTEGSVLAFSAEGSSALILSNYEYAKFRANYQAWPPLGRLWSRLSEHSFSLRVGAGFILAGVPAGGESGAPFFDEFYVGDTSYFRYRRNSLPRYYGLNFAPFNEYGDVLFTAGTEYAFPIVTEGTGAVYRAYIYGALDVTEVTRAKDVLGGNVRGRLLLDHFTPTFDAGFKLETVLGTFTISGSYAVDLIL